MDESILQDLRKLIGGAATDYTYFDQDIMLHATTYLANLVQVGIGTPGFILSSDSQTWRDFLGDSYPPELLPQVRSWLFIKVKLIFDPPISTHYGDKLEEMAKEFEWRMSAEIEPGMNQILQPHEDGE